MSKPVKITLFYADWCTHCEDFLPKWQEMQKMPNIDKKIDFKTYEEAKMIELPPSKQLINGEAIRGYPTIKIEISGKEFDYTGKRNAEAILIFIKTKIVAMLAGENVDDPKDTTKDTSKDTIEDNPKKVEDVSSDSAKVEHEDEMIASIKKDMDATKKTIQRGGGGGGYAKRLNQNILTMHQMSKNDKVLSASEFGF